MIKLYKVVLKNGKVLIVRVESKDSPPRADLTKENERGKLKHGSIEEDSR